MYEKWCKVLDAVPARDTSLEEELQRQQQNEALRVKFAEIANEVGVYIEERSSALAELSMQGKDTMEEQLEAVKEFQTETMSHQSKLDEAESVNQVGVISLASLVDPGWCDFDCPTLLHMLVLSARGDIIYIYCRDQSIWFGLVCLFVCLLLLFAFYKPHQRKQKYTYFFSSSPLYV